jgi:hypothetical protein
MNNKSCIFTIIKNEHQYLDEWIKYHLDLGINHIFIFEDIDSDSHKDITEKYGDKVSLNSILDIFEKNKKREIIELKKINFGKIQQLYTKTGVSWLKKMYPNQYDWCFVIDNDEFITFEDENDNIEDVLFKYNEYDAFLMQWKCYGANGYVEKPDYSDKGVVDIYSEPMKGVVPTKDFFLTKTCYNLNSFNEINIGNLHQPSDECKWCRTNFEKSRNKQVYNTIYIRHYITRSWEEYIYKLKIRGFMAGIRNYDFFFNINPEMKVNKKEMIEFANKMLNNDVEKIEQKNTSCVLTVIKNEHQYLDEWVKYHLNIGIDHIFIFEDIDSDSHKDITEKYGDKVSLYNILTILNEDLRKEAFNLKKTKMRNPQELYFKVGLMTLKLTYPNQYDWCFVIDNDEFITFENENDNIKSILSQFQTYDAFLMQWKCYGANGYVEKPDYSDKGIIDTYTEVMRGYMSTKSHNLTKTCYNLNTYKESYFGNVHQPNDECNFCRTDFTSDRYSIVYNKIYLRHYITKSWEEYVWKVKDRGFIYGTQRKIDNFFEINADMANLKETLMDSLKPDDKLIVLPYIQNRAQGKELQLTLMAWKKFCKFKFHFIVIGEFDDLLPKEFPWVEFIRCPSVTVSEKEYVPHLDIQMKLEIIMRMYGTEYDGFIRTSDDVYPIKPFDFDDIATVHYISDNIIGNKNAPIDSFPYNKWKTKQLLNKEKLPCVDYTTHYPYWYDFSNLKEIWDKFNMRYESYVLEDVYFNYFNNNERILADESRFFIKEYYDFHKEELNEKLDNPNIKFISNSIFGWCEELENKIEKIIEETV